MEHASENRPFRRIEISLWAVPPSSSVRNTSLPTSRNYRPSPLNSGRWKRRKWIVEIGQMIVSIIALALSLNEILKDQFKAWTVCCLVTLLLLYLSCRLGFGIMETFGHLFCFFSFLVWFINMRTENLGWKWMVFLIFSHIKVIAELLITLFQTSFNLLYIHLLERLEDETRSTRGASAETDDDLPKYKFKAKKSSEGNGRKDESESSGEDGIMIAVGSKKESPVSAEDATCCICLGKYKDDEDLRELPCRHHFHVECVDKWLNINASCPLCKRKIGESSEAALQSLPLWWSELGRIG